MNALLRAAAAALVLQVCALANAGARIPYGTYDATPFLDAFEKHMEAKLRAHMVDSALERRLASEKLAEKGAAESDIQALIDPATTAEAKAELRKKLLDKGIEQEMLDRLTNPPVPMKLEVRSVEDLVPKGDHATAKFRVAMAGGTKESTWDVDFEHKQREGWQVASIRFPPPKFGGLNYAVVALYLLAMLGIGWWTSRFIKGTRGFFIADGRLNYFVVGVSILTAYLSALTMMGLPGTAFGKLDWLYAIQLPFLIITAFVITRFVLKRYRDAGVISVYEYLEQRIHVSSRFLASICFILFAIGRMGLVLYLPALAFHIITGFPLVWTIVAMGAVVTGYTIMGGIEAVIWTDFVQAFVMLAGALVSVAYVLVGTGLGGFMDIAARYHKFRIIAPGADLAGLLTLWLILETIFQTIRIYGTQQDITQRYMTTPSTRDANKSVWVAICSFIPFGFLFLFIGTALFVYYQVSPDPTVAGLIANNRADSIYPYFVASRLPPVLAGVVVAAIFAAAMSSIDACMNANSTVCVEDFYRRFRGDDTPDEHYLSVARWLTLVWGALATAMAIMFINIQYAQIVWGKIMATSTNGVLGLMALAFLKRRVHWVSAVVGFGVSYLVLFAMMWFVQIEPTFAITYPVRGSTLNFLLWPVVGNLVCFGVALLVDLPLRSLSRPAAA